ncbi:MAG TPA: SH3 domain-containing protein [Acidobacteriaceae bacterium]|nr:SH3 domain-containing protein [Acidobacteriaceae bacterium]
MSDLLRQFLPSLNSRRVPGIPWNTSIRVSHVPAVLVFSLMALLSGCSHLHRASTAEHVYVSVKKIYLRDRVAVVANRVVEVKNGERLTVLQHIPRFMKVKTPDGAVGWIEEHAVIDQSEYNAFQNLAKQHASQTPVATAVLYNELYMHLTPGRSTQRFTLLAPNTKVAMLERASVPRYAASNLLGLPTAPVKAPPAHGKIHKQSFDARFAPAVPMEDWWLARDSAGQTGWMLARDFQVDVPDDVAQYAESERMVGAYVLRTVSDPDSGKPNGQVPEYLTVLTPYKQGLPFDFDQVRVFTWDTRRHRYGTAFREHDIVGFFPVKVTPGNPTDPKGPEPTFTFQIAEGDNVSLDPETGRPRAAALKTVTYRMEGNLVRAVLPAGAKPAPKLTGAVRSRAKHAGRHRRSP